MKLAMKHGAILRVRHKPVVINSENDYCFILGGFYSPTGSEIHLASTVGRLPFRGGAYPPIGDIGACGISSTSVAFRGDFPRFAPL